MRWAEIAAALGFLKCAKERQSRETRLAAALGGPREEPCFDPEIPINVVELTVTAAESIVSTTGAQSERRDG